MPWGSRSMISVRNPSSARQAPTLMAVVVLPTPPFWLATAITLGSDRPLRRRDGFRLLRLHDLHSLVVRTIHESRFPVDRTILEPPRNCFTWNTVDRGPSDSDAFELQDVDTMFHVKQQRPRRTVLSPFGSRTGNAGVNTATAPSRRCAKPSRESWSGDHRSPWGGSLITIRPPGPISCAATSSVSSGGPKPRAVTASNCSPAVIRRVGVTTPDRRRVHAIPARRPFGRGSRCTSGVGRRASPRGPGGRSPRQPRDTTAAADVEHRRAGPRHRSPDRFQHPSSRPARAPATNPWRVRRPPRPDAPRGDRSAAARRSASNTSMIEAPEPGSPFRSVSSGQCHDDTPRRVVAFGMAARHRRWWPTRRG